MGEREKGLTHQHNVAMSTFAMTYTKKSADDLKKEGNEEDVDSPGKTGLNEKYREYRNAMKLTMKVSLKEAKMCATAKTSTSSPT